MNWHGVRTIYAHEMARFWRTLWESLASPALSTVLYFVVFGAAIGTRIDAVDQARWFTTDRAGHRAPKACAIH